MKLSFLVYGKQFGEYKFSSELQYILKCITEAAF